MRQNEEAECGLACLVMTARFLGHDVDLHEMRKRAGPISRGASFATLIEVLNTFGIAARGIRLATDGFETARLPLILHWDSRHYVVMARLRRGRALIHDPAGYSAWLPLRQVREHYDGFAIETTSDGDPTFETAATRTSLRTLLSGMTGLKSIVAQIVVLSIFLQTVTLILPYYVQLAVDRALPSSNREVLRIATIAFGALALVNGAIMLARAGALIYLGAVFGDAFAAKVTHRLFRLPIDWFRKRETGEILTKFQSIIPIKHVLADDLPAAVIDGMLAMTTLAMMVAYSWNLSLIAVATLGVYAIARIALMVPQRTALSDMIRSIGSEQSFLLNSLQSMRSLRLACGEDMQLEIWRRKFSSFISAEVRYKRFIGGQTILQTTLVSLETIVVVWIAIGLVMDDRLSLGMVFAFLSYKAQFMTAGIAIVDKYSNFRELDSHMDRLDDILRAEADEAFASAVPPRASVEGRLELRGVSFRYGRDERMVLQDIDLVIGAGESVAITGPSGGGKSTLAQLLLGLYRPTAGAMLVDGVNMSCLGYRNYYREVAAVLQDETLFSGTVLENIVLPTQDLDYAFVERCAQAAAIHEEIAAWPLGYSTMVGEMGSLVSSGQRQRILLARALYCRPKILVLDEGTANLDRASERKVNEAIRRLGVTRIIFAHRRETIESADRVLVLRDGRLRSSAERDDAARGA